MQKYGVSVLPVNCEQLKREDVIRILNQVLKEFPVTQIRFSIPGWLEVLFSDNWLKAKVIRLARQILEKVTQMKDVAAAIPEEKEEGIQEIRLGKMNLSDGPVDMDIQMDDHFYYQI